VRDGPSNGRLRRHRGYSLRGGAEIRIIAFITEAPAMRQILAYLNEPNSLPYIAPLRGPQLREIAEAGQGEFSPQTQPAQPAPDYKFDQRIVG